MADRMYRQFMWGLANGIAVLAIAGGFFIAMGAVSLEIPRAQWFGIAVTVLGLGLLLTGARSVRRKSTGFSWSELRGGTESERARARRLGLVFRWVIFAEWALFGVVSFLCHFFHADELTAPFIGLVISLHFAPLARLFRLPSYYATALIGSLFAVLSMVLPAERLAVLGLGLGLVMWLTAVDSLVRADRLAARWSSPAG